MKKILLVSALATAMLANAAGLENAKMRNFASDSKKIETTSTPFEWKDAKTIIKEHAAARAPQATEYDAADWYFAPGSFFLGIYEGLSGYSVGVTLLPYMDSVVFYNYYGPSDWAVNGKNVAENTDTYITGYGINGLYYLPETDDHDFNPARDWGKEYKDTTFNIKGTLYGNGNSDQFLASAIEGNSSMLGGQNFHMTLCAMETDVWNEPDYDGSDFWMVGAASLGDVYYNGTGVHLTKGDAATADTIGILVDNRGTMKIEEILFPIYNDGRADAVNKFIPDGAELRVALFPLDEEGIHFDDTIASTVMTNADFVSAGAGYEWVGTLHAKFHEVDIFGTETDVPVWVNGSFYLQLTNFNETGCDFGIYSDFHCPTTGTTVYQHDGMFSYRGGKGGGGDYGQNLGISFDAYWPTLVNDTACYELHADAYAEEEGYAYYGEDPENMIVWLLSNVNYEEWTYETEEDWIEPQIASTDYWEDYSVIALAFAVTDLPEGESGRRGTITFEADGATVEFTIIQGVDPTEGIEDTKVDAKFNNKKYNVLGVEVDDNFKGVVIRNGKKTIVR